MSPFSGSHDRNAQAFSLRISVTTQASSSFDIPGHEVQDPITKLHPWMFPRTHISVRHNGRLGRTYRASYLAVGLRVWEPDGKRLSLQILKAFAIHPIQRQTLWLNADPAYEFGLQCHLLSSLHQLRDLQMKRIGLHRGHLSSESRCSKRMTFLYGRTRCRYLRELRVKTAFFALSTSQGGVLVS